MRTYQKNIRRTIKSTFSRFFAIFSIVALGVGFLAGLLSTTPDIEDSMEKYLDAGNMYDFRVVSTLGLTDDDIEALRRVPGVSGVQAGYSADLLIAVSGGDTTVARVHNLPAGTDGNPAGEGVINRLTLMEGRWPETTGECVIEAGATMQGKSLNVGDHFAATADNDGLDEKLNQTDFTVVGKVRNTYYFSYEREPASVGSGSVSVVFYVQPQTFAYEAYTEMYATVADARALDSLGDTYTDTVKSVTNGAEGIEDARCQARYDGIRADAQTEIDDAWQEYNDAKADADEQLADAAQELADGREALADGEKELTDGEKELSDGETTLNDNVQKVADGQTALDSAMNTLTEGQAAYDANAKTIADGEAQLGAAKQQLDEGWAQYNSGKAQYDENLALVTASETQLIASKAQLDEGQAAYDAGAQQIEQGRAAIATAETAYAGLEQLNKGQHGYDAGVQGIIAMAAAKGITLTAAQAEASFSDAALAAMVASTPEDAMTPEAQAQYAALCQLNGAQKQLNAGVRRIIAQQAAQGVTLTPEQAKALFSDEALAATRAQLDESIAKLDAGEQKLTASKAQLDEGWTAYNAGAAQIAGAKAQLAEAATQLAGAKAQLDAGQAVYDEKGGELFGGKRQLADAKKQLDEGFATLTDKQSELADAQKQIADARQTLADARQELADGRATLVEKTQELRDGEIDYDEAKADADKELADAKTKIEDAESQLDDLEMPKWYVWNRENNVSFHSFRGNVSKVQAIARVFPVFFFLVAALVVLTTMTRMVEEERGQIGTMKALGYTNGTIRKKYLLYALLAAVLGALFGLAVGFTVFPTVIWNAYSMMYYMPKFYSPWRWNYAILSGGSLILCTLIATLSACGATMRETPAEMMRPRAPKAGKRIFLERIPLLWKHLSFTKKVACRNLLRYKRRFWMTVIGVAGCTALLVTGFGISDSINGIITKQYSDVSQYDLMTVVRHPEDTVSGPAYDVLFGGGEVASSVAILTEQVDQTLPDGSSAETYLMVPKDISSFGTYMDLHERVSRRPTPLQESGVVLTEKFADQNNVKAGDSITLENGDGESGTFTITGVCENYVSSYVYLSAAEYERGFGAPPEWNAVLTCLKDDSQAARDTLSSKLLGLDEVGAVNFTYDMMTTVLNMLQSINAVVVMIVICAAGLALIVLYNLTNINIAERVKEIATIKVLGFYDREVNAYVMRENVALSVIGAALGMVLGIWLHKFVIFTVEVDAVMFGRDIEPMSYVYALALTMLFTAIVNGIMSRKLKKISMVESMKAPE